MSETVQQRLRKFREKLLDLSRRNRLLNYRPYRASTVPIVDELPAEVFRLLVSIRKPLHFQPAPEETTQAPPLVEESGAADLEASPGGGSGNGNDSDSDSDSDSGDGEGSGNGSGNRDSGGEASPTFTREFHPYRPEEVAERHVDRWLQTSLAPERLDHNLLRIHQQATSNLEEEGYNSLFLALGALEWRERDDPKRAMIAPVILVPVELRRRSPRRPFRLRPTDEDPILNPALAMKLEQELGIAPPELPDDAEQWDVQGILVALQSQVRDQPGWRVLNDIYLGLFSFTKFIMYRDLEAHAERFALRPLVRALCGDEEARRSLEAVEGASADGKSIDDQLDPESTFQVLDADSSQQEAILAVRRGSSLVLEGPPGTGKSQTITNLIAECLAAGERVLFVSEKMAALEVVHSRLREVGLADFSLVLHSRHASKRQVAEELGRTLELARERVEQPPTRPLERMRELRERLNAHVADLATPLEPLGLSPFEALARSVRLVEAVEVPVPLAGAADWSRERFEATLEALRRLTTARRTLLERFASLDDHPWRGSRLESSSYQGSARLREELAALGEKIDALRRAAGEAAGRVEERPPLSLRAARELVDRVRLLATSPRPSPEAVTDAAWDEGCREVDGLIEACRLLRAARRELGSRWREELLEADLDGLRERAERSSPLGWLRPSWWGDRRALRCLLAPAARLPSRERLLAELRAARDARAGRGSLESARERGERLFGSAWRGAQSDPEELVSRAAWMRRYRAHARGEEAEARAELAARGLEDPEPALAAATETERAISGLEEAWGSLVETARIDPAEAFDEPFEEVELAALAERARRMREEVDSLHDWGRRVAAEREARERGLEVFLRRARQLDVPPEELTEAFERLFLRTWLDHAFSRRPALERFQRKEHERAIEEFRRLDLEQLRLARLRLRARLQEKLPDGDWESSSHSELGILQREVRRKRGHAPLRKLLRRLPQALGRLKPCFLMSPLSVAQYLDPDALRFDVVIFDEASQIAPEDAIGAIARGDRLVVVGDSHQLPPTAFFKKQEAAHGVAIEEEDDALEPEAELESILDECAAAGFPRRMLRWHYRSRHESLIAFSNEQFYDGQLVTFPSCAGSSDELGVGFVHVEEGVYSRGASRSNRPEAERVAAAVLEHFRRRPELSLGVGTFTQAQQVEILDCLEELRRRDESFEDRFDPERPEHFFVKNLENIQGDERDVIMISVGYGRDAHGKVHMAFGPLNTAGGERRLNVLVTRARRRLVLFSSLRPEDVRVDGSAPRGRRLLRSYLEYAARGGPEAREEEEDAGEARPDAPLEASLAERLESAGLVVDREVGSSRLRIGLAVRDPERENRHVLGVEWDGRGYQGRRSARDRDRLRWQVLEGLGWRLHRVWCTEWLRNPQAESERLLAAVEAARRGTKAPEVLPLLGEVEHRAKARRSRRSGPAPEGDREEAREPTFPYARAELEAGGDPEDFEDSGPEVLAALVGVVRAEGPIHRDEAARRVSAAWGIHRLTSPVQRAMETAIERALARGEIETREEGFLWPARDGPPLPRRRDGEGVPREPELIALEELGAALARILERELRVPRDELIARAARLLGYSRTGPKLRERVERALEELVREGDAVENEDGVRPPPEPSG